jgi:hypothetical protein
MVVGDLFDQARRFRASRAVGLQFFSEGIKTEDIPALAVKEALRVGDEVGLMEILQFVANFAPVLR